MLSRPPNPALLSSSLVALLFLAISPPAAAPQTPSSTPSSLALSVQSRLVLEDILVFDHAGHPVFDLPQSAFHVTDNGHPQTIRFFESGSVIAPPTTAATLPPATFSNVDNTSDHSAVMVILIDADSMAVTDQMYLLQELKSSLASIPPSLEVAVFRVYNGRVVQIRGFERNLDDLQQAFRECLPVFTEPVDNPFGSALNQLTTISAFLQGTRGRKNLLWFAGAFPLIPISEADIASRITPDVEARQHTIHQMQEALAEARISVYPVDVRGVIPLNIPNSAALGAEHSAKRNPAATSGVTKVPTVLSPGPLGVVAERDEMRDIASATGGRAYTLNQLGPEIAQAYTLGARAYSLFYSPAPYTTDESWHRVRITVDSPPNQGPYTLSYRPGYLATWTGLPGGRVGVRLDSTGQTHQAGGSADANAAKPLPFEVHITPGPAVAGHNESIPITLDFSIPVREIDFRHNGSSWRAQLVVASYTYTAEGRIRGGRMQQFDTTLSDQQWSNAVGKNFPIHQTVEVPHNADYLMLEMRDSTNQRAGSLMLSMRVVRSLASGNASNPGSAAPPSPSGPHAPRPEVP